MSNSSVRATRITPIANGFFKVRFERQPKARRAGNSKSKLLRMTNPDDTRFTELVSVVATSHNFNAKGLKDLLGFDASTLKGEQEVNITNEFTASLGISVVEATSYEEMCAKIGVTPKADQKIYAVKRYNSDGKVHLFANGHGTLIYKATSLIIAADEPELEELVPGTPIYTVDSIEEIAKFFEQDESPVDTEENSVTAKKFAVA